MNDGLLLLLLLLFCCSCCLCADAALYSAALSFSLSLVVCLFVPVCMCR